MTLDPMDKARAAATLSTIVQRGDTVFLIRRVAGRNARNKIIDLRLAAAPTKATACELVGMLFGKVYIYSRGGLLFRKDESAEDLIKMLSVELFGEPNHLKAVWL